MMNTLEFLRAILPEEGVHYVGIMQEGKHGMAHHHFLALEDMAEAIRRLDAKPGLAVYHACASYRELFVEVPDRRTGELKKKRRIAENASQVKALWADLDVGEDKATKGKGYATQKDAAAAMLGFCRDAGFPAPMIVNSGSGLHFYWPFEEAIDADEWVMLGANFKVVLAHYGVLADPTRTADVASVLRPVGSHNRKYGEKEVKVIKAAGPYPVEVLRDRLGELVSELGLDVFTHSPPSYANGLNDDLLAHAYPEIEVDAEVVADGCQQVRMMRDTQGDVEYEHWRGVIGILTFCKDGHAKAHEWSERRIDTGHGQNDVDTKYMTWNSGPSTCEFFGTINPSGCDGCKFKDTIKSPLVLGRVEPEPEKELQKEAIVDDKPIIVDVPEELPGFKYDESLHQMVHYVRNKDGVLEAIPFSHYHVYPMTRICQSDGTFAVRVRMHMPKKKLREFDLPTYVVAVGGQELAKEMGKYEHMITDNKDAAMHLTAYMRNALNRLVRETEEMHTMTSFGWKDGMSAFLIGDRLYKKDGTTHKVVLGGTAASKAIAFPVPRGTPEGWADGVNYLYNREGAEAMQYALCSAFGSILSPFGETLYKGIPLALTSSGSGKGKTTVCQAALYAFGDANVLTINGKQGMTDNARPGLMGTYNNIPMLVDEITRIKDDELSALLYAASNGKDKERMVSRQGQGVVLAEASTWAMSMYMTANKHLSLLLSSGQGNTKAEAVRIFEIKMDNYKMVELPTLEVSVANNKIERNMGSAGEKFVQWCVTHVDEIEARFIATNKMLTELNAHTTHAEYRYYRQHAVCTLVAAGIMKELGMLGFDTERLQDFTTKHIDKMCADATEYNEVSHEEALNRMINFLSPRILNTVEYRGKNDARGPEDVGNIHGEVAGRYILGDALGKEPLAGRLYLVKKEIRDWCLKNRVDYDSIIEDATDKGWVIHVEDDRFQIGRGTNRVSPQVRCLVLDTNRMSGEGVKPSLHVVQHGDRQA